jgi:hypothetical protein
MASGAVVSSLRLDAPVFAPSATVAKTMPVEDAKEHTSVLRPVQRGEKTCLCKGQLQAITSQCGWILPYGQIEHADAWKNNGCVYLGPGDFTLLPGSQLRPGADVEFFLFADEYGMGAEDCKLKDCKGGAKNDMGVITMAPLWLLEDSDDDDMDEMDELPPLPKGKAKSSKDVDVDAGLSTDCGGTTSCDEFDEEEDEEDMPTPTKASPLVAASEASTRANSTNSSPAGVGIVSPRPESVSSKKSKKSSSAIDDLMAELAKARASAREALDESKSLGAEAQIVTELREARSQEQASAVPVPTRPSSDDAEVDDSKSTASTQATTPTEQTDLLDEAMPSKGSALHFMGNCKSCSFFPVGRCTKGADCPFCHLSHDRRRERKERRKERIASAFELKETVAASLCATDDADMAVEVAVRSELLRHFGAPPGLALVAPPGLA